MKKNRGVTLIAFLMLMLGLNLLALSPAFASDTPCTDGWSDCLEDGHCSCFCDGMWCGCMHATYGYEGGDEFCPPMNMS